ncbi:MAG: acyltransferase family protein [Eubacteriales bacterium]|nr:acyltransferase family protein [Eubacteriales bacterium]
MQQRKYYDEITIAKGIGILLVVLGHAIKQIGVEDSISTTILQVIYSFHMPLFFVLSGFVSVKILSYEGKEYGSFLKKRACRLLIPYFVVGILYLPLKYLLSQFARKPYDFANCWRLILGENPNTTLWFLYILFLVSVLTLLLVRKNTLHIFLIFAAVLSVLTFHFGWEIKVTKYFFFFLLGIYLRIHYGVWKKMMEKVWFVFLAFLVFLAGNIALYYGMEMAGFFTSISGMILTLVFSLKILSIKKEKHGMLYRFGDASMDIYILSDIVQTVLRLAFWNILHLPAVFVMVICFVGGIYGSIIAAKWILRRFYIFRMLFFGEWEHR